MVQTTLDPIAFHCAEKKQPSICYDTSFCGAHKKRWVNDDSIFIFVTENQPFETLSALSVCQQSVLLHFWWYG